MGLITSSCFTGLAIASTCRVSSRNLFSRAAISFRRSPKKFQIFFNPQQPIFRWDTLDCQNALAMLFDNAG